MYNHLLTDSVFTEARRILYKNNHWRFGDNRTKIVVDEFMEHLNRHTTIMGKRYFDLGCGKHNPFGHSIIMYLNGATETIAFDLVKYEDNKRASEAIYDLLANCALNPKKWIYTEVNESQFMNRIRSIDVDALRLGNLKEGLNNLPLKHIQGNINTTEFPDNSVDIVTSRSVLEHFLNFDIAIRNLYRFLNSNSFSFHSIDLVDHRAYRNPKKYNYWSFLCKPDDWTDNLCNRLRSSEIRTVFENVGFEVSEWNVKKHVFPKNLRNSLKGRFRDMSDEELSITGVNCVLRKK